MSSWTMECVKIEGQPEGDGLSGYASLHRSTDDPPGAPAGIGHFSFVACDGGQAMVVVTASMLTGVIGCLVELRDRLADLEAGVSL